MVGCLVLYVALFAAMGSVLVWAGYVELNAAATCIPSDFPRYSPALWAGSSYSSETACVESELTLSSGRQVYGFYESSLNQPGGAWTATATFGNAYEVLNFKHTQGQPIAGHLWFVDRGGPNVICSYFDRNSPATAGMSSVVAMSRSAPADGAQAYARKPLC